MLFQGSRPVKKEAERLGLDKIFMDAGFEWRDPGICSMCWYEPRPCSEGVHCASTSNRSFEGRQGYGARTHLCSPAMAAAQQSAGKFVDVRDMPEIKHKGEDNGKFTVYTGNPVPLMRNDNIDTDQLIPNIILESC